MPAATITTRTKLAATTVAGWRPELANLARTIGSNNRSKATPRHASPATTKATYRAPVNKKARAADEDSTMDRTLASWSRAYRRRTKYTHLAPKTKGADNITSMKVPSVPTPPP